nr:unnamed protein product [Callosobruchus chinensis]
MAANLTVIVSDKECYERYGVAATKGKPRYTSDTEVICTSFYSRLTPLEDGEHPECECTHRTCGPSCDRCCPLFNQRKWAPGSWADANACAPCNCHGHAVSCHYDESVDRAGISMDVDGNYQGGGVCDNCTEFTTGINCERCLSGYYRPLGVLPNATEPCLACNCDPMGAIDLECDIEGKCRCRTGYEGDKCERCALGYDGWPRCEACACDDKGTAPNANKCAAETCQCKANVEGRFCDRCKPGYFGLRSDLEEGCLPCYCSGITGLCESAVVLPQKIDSLKEWLVTDLNVSKVAQPNHNAQGVFSLGNYDFHGTKHLYWLAPELYSGNKLHAYASDFTYKVQWVVMRGDTSGEPTIGPNIVIAGNNGLKIAQGYDIYTSSKMTFHIKMNEKGWYFLEEEAKLPTAQNSFEIRPVSRQDFLSILSDIKYVLLRSTFHTDQIEALLEEAKWEVGVEEEGYSSVEKCSCPSDAPVHWKAKKTTSVRAANWTFSTKATAAIGATFALSALRDTQGTTAKCWKCEKCKPEHYGDPAQLNCKACECDSIGSASKQCDNNTGQCECKEKFTGRTCDKCEVRRIVTFHV